MPKHVLLYETREIPVISETAVALRQYAKAHGLVTYRLVTQILQDWLNNHSKEPLNS